MKKIYLKNKCEVCGNTQGLTIHHKEEGMSMEQMISKWEELTSWITPEEIHKLTVDERMKLIDSLYKKNQLNNLTEIRKEK